MERKKWYACQFLWYTALEEVKRKSKLFSLRRFLILHLRKKFGFYISLDKNDTLPYVGLLLCLASGLPDNSDIGIINIIALGLLTDLISASPEETTLVYQYLTKRLFQ